MDLAVSEVPTLDGRTKWYSKYPGICRVWHIFTRSICMYTYSINHMRPMEGDTKWHWHHQGTQKQRRFHLSYQVYKWKITWKSRNKKISHEKLPPIRSTVCLFCYKYCSRSLPKSWRFLHTTELPQRIDEGWRVGTFMKRNRNERWWDSKAWKAYPSWEPKPYPPPKFNIDPEKKLVGRRSFPICKGNFSGANC